MWLGHASQACAWAGHASQACGQDAGMHGSHACHLVPVMHAIVVSERHGIVYMCQ